MPTTRKKVLLIGWDGADWKAINPLLDAGKMPNLERLVNEGVTGNLTTLSPSFSPMLWTSIATGKRPFEHGICGFTEPDPDTGWIRPITNLSRRTRTIWNILHLNDMTCNIVGWWPSHPAEPIRGTMVSNLYQQIVGPMDKSWPVLPGTIHPERLVEPLGKSRVHPEELTADHIGPFVPDFAQIDPEKDLRLKMLGKTLCECTSIHAAATALIQLEPWDFMAVYYDSIDHFCHAFMHYHPPRMDGISETDFNLYKGVVEGAYRYHDAMLGVLTGLAGRDTTVILVSDHGFHPDHLRPTHIPSEPAGPAVQHSQHGIFLMKGPGIKQDELIHGASLLDIAPTILTLLELSVGLDMDGSPLVNAFEVSPKVAVIDSWDDVPGEDGSHPPDQVVDPVAAHEALNRLVALGYIEKPDENRENAARQTIRELKYNTALSYMDANRHAEAVGDLEELYEEWPDEYRFGLQLVDCYQALDRVVDARRVLDTSIARKTKNAAVAAEKLREWREQHQGEEPGDLSKTEQFELRRLQREASTNPFAVEFLQGVQLLTEGDPEAALAYFQNAEIVDSGVPAVHIKKALIYLRMRRWQKAEESFRAALKIDDADSAAHLGLCRSLLARGRTREATDAALDAIGLTFHNPAAHFLLGVALHRRGMVLRAIEALRVCLAQNPNSVEAHQRLAYIYEHRVKNPAQAAEHRRLAEEAEARVDALRQGEIKFGPDDAGRRARTSDQEVLETGRDILKEMSVPLKETITVVSGLPRSGTSMMMQMLAAGGLPLLEDGKRSSDRHNPRGYFEYSLVKALKRDASWLPGARGKAVKVIAQLLPLVPRRGEFHYRIIFMERSLKEVVASQHDMLREQEAVRRRSPDEALKKAFGRQLQRIRKLLAAARFPVIYVSHRDCIQDPRGIAARVNAFLGGALDERAMAAAIQPSLYRHRERGDHASYQEA